MGVVALAVGEGVQVKEGGWVGYAGELICVIGGGDSGELRLAVKEVLAEGV